MRNTFIKRYVCNTSSYEAAIKKLCGLQSNSTYLKLATKNNSQTSDTYKLLDTIKYLVRSGITLEKLDTLSVIHVAGTKGKGSTCAYTEAILREHGFKTGFFSSPHLISARERIRLNGQPISEMHFTQNFWKIYKKLEDTREYESDMPAYFNFLTVLMFNVFLDEHVDVAIIEVGIGGLYDCTNIVRNPVCVGITSLGLDHTSLLGNSLEDIAYQKSGIFKSGTIAFSVPQLPQAMYILEKRAIEKNYGAHTIESIKCCISWFNDISNKNRGKKFLIFNTSGIKSLDDEVNCSLIDEQKIKCEMNSKIWGTNSMIANSVFEVLQDIKNNSEQNQIFEKNQILVTGSLHLIGTVLTILDPNLTMNTQF